MNCAAIESDKQSQRTARIQNHFPQPVQWWICKTVNARLEIRLFFFDLISWSSQENWYVRMQILFITLKALPCTCHNYTKQGIKCYERAKCTNTHLRVYVAQLEKGKTNVCRVLLCPINEKLGIRALRLEASVNHNSPSKHVLSSLEKMVNNWEYRL